MNPRDVLTNFREGGIRGRGCREGDGSHTEGGAGDIGKGTDMHIELEPAEHEEPTWEMHRPGESYRRRLNGRARVILSAAAAAAVVANAGAVWAYWRLAQPGRPASSAPVVEMALRGRSDLDRPLRPGATGNLTVTVTNDRSTPIRITSIAPGAGNVIADDEHREKGCAEPRVQIVQSAFPVAWDVPKNTVGAFTLPDALTMRPGGPAACAGAVFTVPVQARGVERR